MIDENNIKNIGMKHLTNIDWPSLNIINISNTKLNILNNEIDKMGI